MERCREMTAPRDGFPWRGAIIQLGICNALSPGHRSSWAVDYLAREPGLEPGITVLETDALAAKLHPQLVLALRVELSHPDSQSGRSLPSSITSILVAARSVDLRCRSL